jgi:hypothetical protein
MTGGILIFAWGVWECGWIVDVVVNPETPGQWFQIGGTIIATGFLLLLIMVSIAKRKFQRALFCPLVLALIVILCGLSARGWAFEFPRGWNFYADADGSAGQDLISGDDSNLGANDGENIQTVAVMVVGAIALTAGCVRGVTMILPMYRRKCTIQRGRQAVEIETARRLAKIRSKIHYATSDETDVRTSKPRQTEFTDDCYSRLDGTQYLHCRTQVVLERMKRDVQPLGYKLQCLKVCALVSTTVSVVLGSFDLDIFIAASTALVSFFTTAQENGDYKRKLEINNIGIKRLQAAELEWKSLPFAEKRDPRAKEKLVQQTEQAIMELANSRYPTGSAAVEASRSKDPSSTDENSGKAN